MQVAGVTKRSIPAFFDPRQLAHQPALELHNGSWADYAEKASRAEFILREFGAPRPVSDHGLDPILRVHSLDYVEFLRGAHSAWIEAGRNGDATCRSIASMPGSVATVTTPRPPSPLTLGTRPIGARSRR